MLVTLHDGSRILLRKADSSFPPTLRSAAMRYLEAHSSRGEVVTGVLYINEDMPLVHDIAGTTATPLTDLPYERLSPGSEALNRLQKRMR